MYSKPCFGSVLRRMEKYFDKRVKLMTCIQEDILIKIITINEKFGFFFAQKIRSVRGLQFP